MCKHLDFAVSSISVSFTLRKTLKINNMKKNLSRLLIIAAVVFSLNSYAQLTPAPSSTQTIVQNFGLGKITLSYSRPNVKGRKIFGYTEPYNAVWRTGANAATTITFTDDVTLEGHKVAAGEYGLFSIPGEDEWTIILSKTPKQWGAYSYNAIYQCVPDKCRLQYFVGAYRPGNALNYGYRCQSNGKDRLRHANR
jgi:hypothetical protein